jgi:hypothetical protein
MNKFKIVLFLILIIKPLFCSSLDIKTIKQFLIIEAAISTSDIKVVNDINKLITLIEYALKKDSSVYKNTSLELYFKTLDLEFYKFSKLGTIERQFSRVIAIDEKKNIFFVNEPLAFINELIDTHKLDTDHSLVFKSLINIYEKIEFINEDVEFHEEYDQEIFGPEVVFEQFYNIIREKEKIIMMKMYQIKNQPFTDRYQISYILENNNFSIKKLLVSRK